MLLPGEEPLDSIEPPSCATSAPVNGNHEALLSPSIQRVVGEKMAAFEVKFLIHDTIARQVEDWAAATMDRDAYANPNSGWAYQTTTLYLDTPQRDVFHRAEGHRKRKFRLRRYGSEQRIYLERKTRQGDRVAKRRSDVPMSELGILTNGCTDTAWPGFWFRQRVQDTPLLPACRLTYDRTAFVKLTADGPLRLTLDRRIRGVAATDWDLSPLDAGHSILPEHVICEFKFRGAMPNLYKDVIAALQLEAGSVSKYRRMMLATGVMPDEGPGHA